MRTLLPLLLALVGVASVYAVGLDNGFVWLDQFEIVEGALIVDSPSAFFALFGDDHNFAGYHRPIYNLIHSVDRAWSGLDPWGFQLSSRLYHLLNVVLVFWLARRCGWQAWSAGIAAALFGLHPVNTAAAGLIHSKADLFVFTALAGSTALFLGRGPRPSGSLGRLASLCVFVLALFTKETAFLFPIGATLWLLFGKVEAVEQRRPWKSWLIGLWALAILAGLARLAATDTAYPSALSLGERLATFCFVYVDYVRKLVLPLDLSVADTVTRFTALGTAARIQGFGAFAFLVAGQVFLWRRLPAIRKWIVLYHLALLPVSQIIPILHFRADRFLYVPSLAFVGAAVENIGCWLASRKTSPQAIGLAAGLVLTAYGARDVSRLREFESNQTLFASELLRRPDYLEGITHLARDLDRAGRFDQARELYAFCLQPHPEIVSYIDGEGTLLAYSANLLAGGLYQEAYGLIDRVQSTVRNPTVASELAYNRGVAARRLGNHEEALTLLTAYGEAHPGDASCFFLIGQTASALGRKAEARRAFERYLSLVPDAPERASIERTLAED